MEYDRGRGGSLCVGCGSYHTYHADVLLMCSTLVVVYNDVRLRERKTFVWGS